MKVVMTLLARDEADIVESWLAFHLNAGADFVIATDNRSEDGTTEILERYEREGHVHLIREPGEDLRQNEWVTRMARLAATDFGADWVINSDADELWWPRGASLRDVLAAVPPRYGTVGAFLRMFVPRPGNEEPFERMTVRFSALAPINDPASLYKPIRKIVHRAHAEIEVTRGNHALVDSPFAPLRGWYPIEVFHFPLRSLEQCTHKAALQGNAFEKYIQRPPTAYHANMFEALRSGTLEQYYDSLVVDDDEVERGVEARRLVVDTRLRDALRELRTNDRSGLSFPIPSLVEDAEYAVEAAVLGEADVVRLQRRLDTLERRLLTLELRLPTRVYRKLSRTAKRALGRDAQERGQAEA
ncbi:MAG: glycosyltransferase family 2 protein [Actinobacteria bacterium]|nr:glycosyltransferase family 2 protein [Actinomycetota bacterium]